MIVGKIENGSDRGFVKHRLNCLLITDLIVCESSYRLHMAREKDKVVDNKVVLVLFIMETT